MDLRPYQTACIDAARLQIRAGKKRVLLVCPTGGGKTVIASEIIRSAGLKGARVLFLAHRRELIQQTCDKLNRFGVAHGVIQAGYPMALQRSVQVASVQTLIRRLSVLSRVDLVFVDEAHHVTAGNTYSKILEAYPGAVVLGLTATPWRLDGQGLGDVFDSHVLAATPRELRELAFLVPVGGWEYEAIDTESARVQRGDFVQADLQASAKSARVVGDAVAEWLQHAGGKRTVLFATSIDHSKLMADEFRKAGVPAEHVDGEMPEAERDQVLARLRSGQTLVVCNCNVLTEGFDCPELEVCILLRPTLSTSLALQMIGRILRPAPGKTMARIHDHAGVLAAHGHPYAERDYSPETDGRTNRNVAKQTIPPSKRCKACKSIVARWPCDSCGFAPDPSEIRVEYDPAATRREITGDGVAPKKKTETDAERKEKWRKRYAHDLDGTQRQWFFLKMVDKWGPAKGARVYRWVSGFCESPRPEWLERQKETATL